MSRTTTNHAYSDDGLQPGELGRLPRNAVTEWMCADAPCSVELEEDNCENVVGKGIGVEKFDNGDPSVVNKRIVHSSHQNCVTNRHWADEEVKQHNLRHPNNPWTIRHSWHNSNYICIVKAIEE